jgi:hypothetical protein
MRRAAIALGLVALLTSSCGDNELSAELAATLQDQVALIRHDVEAGRPGYARNDLNELVAMVAARLDRGQIDEQRATEILESADAVAAQLSLLPRPSPSETPSPSPEEKDQGKGEGHKDKGHGND